MSAGLTVIKSIRAEECGHHTTALENVIILIVIRYFRQTRKTRVFARTQTRVYGLENRRVYPGFRVPGLHSLNKGISYNYTTNHNGVRGLQLSTAVDCRIGVVNKLDRRRRRVLLTTRSTCRGEIFSVRTSRGKYPNFWRYPNFLVIQCVIGGRKLQCQNQVDSSSCFDTIPACDRWTDGRTDR